eukprot:TRINITY_DN24639_c0_g1_i1.p1 TRINITY_DN24639_c0_g1~~TRINITY_DN24639_c0_g1_i1.p1  ORF type:complete len:204 (+),score=46.66 TRINITY_DN24639_c0_g1_i1:364-975(+)
MHGTDSNTMLVLEELISAFGCDQQKFLTVHHGQEIIAPTKVNFDEFHNNTAHSMGWYGFWIFGQSNHATYDPHTGDVSKGYCNGERTQARIGSFTTWNNKRGFEIVSGANIRLENQTHMDHDFAGFEIFTAKGPYGEDGPGIFNTVIVGHSEISDLTEGKETACTPVESTCLSLDGLSKMSASIILTGTATACRPSWKNLKPV